MYEFSMSLLMFWIKGRVNIGSNSVKVKVPNIVFGFMPLGSKEDIIPIKNISNIQINSEFKLVPLLIGGFMALGSFPDIFSIGGLLFTAFWLFVAASGLKTTLTFDKSGTQQYISVPFYERRQMQAIQNDIHEQLIQFDDRSNSDIYFDKKEVK